MGAIAIVTGASSGMGREFVRQLDQGGAGPLSQIWVVARRQELLNEVAAQAKTPVRTFALDLTQAASFDALEAALAEACDGGSPAVDSPTADSPATGGPTPGGNYLQLLINCAGFGRCGDYREVGRAANADMVLLNCLAVVQMCSLALPRMRPGSRIINLASMAGTLPLPGFATYSASKSFVLDFSRALASELGGTGISVTAVCPKWMRTPFLDHVGDEQTYRSMTFIGFEDPVRVARKALRSSTLGLSVCVPSPDMKLAYAALSVLPASVAMGFMSLMAGARRHCAGACDASVRE